MTMDVSKSEPSKNGAAQQECAGCGKTITERYLLKALDMFWHEDCLKCSCCACRLVEVGSTLYTKSNLILCKRDYLRFCIGDRFYLYENKILCEYDYEERLVFANMAVHPPPTATLAQIKRQVTHLQPQTISTGSPQRHANGETTHNHNGYPAPASSSAHNILNPMNNLNGINAQTPYDTK
ncbi:uncharacterized protein LOC143151099 isoform X2 [Ptiloglossa arizonensis]|uniref:uncharacterized protein LOC143151099 isoform X2 n=1 Tax=Ptiloglossa arizonensis TaxID=3350558 RepID=UPI003FA0C5AF